MKREEKIYPSVFSLDNLKEYSAYCENFCPTNSLTPFLNAKINSGIEEILKISNVEKEIVDNTILITGEGKFDNQSVQGKVISGIVEMSKNKKAKVIVVAGCVDLTEDLVEVDKIFSCSELGRSIDDVKKTCKEDLNKAVNEMYKYIEEKYL